MLLTTDPMLPLTAARSPWLRGTIATPGDATQAQLALLLAGLARGESVSGGARVTVSGERVTLRGPRFAVPLEVGLALEAAPLIGPLLVLALASSGRSILHLPAELADPAQHLIASFGGKFAGDATRLSL